MKGRVLRLGAVVLGVALAILVALRVFRVARLVTLAGLVGAIVVVVWLLMPTLTIPRISSEGPVVRNGVAVVVACGKKRGLLEATKYAAEPQTGGWWPVRKGECTLWYHRPPLPEQRFNRHERASEAQERQEPERALASFVAAYTST